MAGLSAAGRCSNPDSSGATQPEQRQPRVAASPLVCPTFCSSHSRMLVSKEHVDERKYKGGWSHSIKSEKGWERDSPALLRNKRWVVGNPYKTDLARRLRSGSALSVGLLYPKAYMDFPKYEQKHSNSLKNLSYFARQIISQRCKITSVFFKSIKNFQKEKRDKIPPPGCSYQCPAYE